MMQVPEVECMDPENYKKYFRSLYWSGSSREKKNNKLRATKKDKVCRLRPSTTVTLCHAPTLLANPSQFTVFSTVRKAILTRWRHLQSVSSDLSDESDSDDNNYASTAKLPKVTGIGLRAVFSLVSKARFADEQFCEHALRALLDVLQGHAPEELRHEPAEIIANIHAMLIEVAVGAGSSDLTSLSASCLVALTVGRGDSELILGAVTALLLSPPALADQTVQIPSNLTALQRSVQAYILGTPARNLWHRHGVPNQALVASFPVDLPASLTSGQGELVVRALASDGSYIYVYTSRGLLKIGSGYGNSIRQHLYLYKPDFFPSDRHGWLGCCKNKLYVRIGRKKTEVYEIDKESLELRNVIRLEPGLPSPIEPKSAMFTDGRYIGLMFLTSNDSLTVRVYDLEPSEERGDTNTVSSMKDLNVHLLRRKTLIFGDAPYEEGMLPLNPETETPIAVQLDDCDDDPLVSIASGQDFGLLITASGKIFYTGKPSSLGYKAGAPNCTKWVMMKETLLNRNDIPNNKKYKVSQIAVGHEGTHAILVLDNGTALFTGVSRRGEDGDHNRHRRSLKPSRPKKMAKTEGHHIVYAACNYGSSALVTKTGGVLMFGKDILNCDPVGSVTGLSQEKIVQISLGKAHAAALNKAGQVFTFGINNKGQCGREFGYTKEKVSSMRRRRSSRDETHLCSALAHTWAVEYCRVCMLCRECTGFSSECQCADFPNRVPGERCGCGEGDSGCITCGACRRCADAFAAAAAERPDEPDDSDTAMDQAESSTDPESSSGAETDASAGVKMTSLPPGRVAVPGGHKVKAVACGLHHTVLLTEKGEVLTFGSNQCGQLGAGDMHAHHRIVRVRMPHATAVAAGSHHTVVLTKEGEVFTFGNYQKGSLGRTCTDEPAAAAARPDARAPLWFATPTRVPRIGPRFNSTAVWIGASGDHTYVRVSQALIKTDTLFSSTITANGHSIVILPNRPEHAFKCLTINKADGSCYAWSGPEQVDFVNSLACLDPLYDVLWCYQPQMRVMKCFNILAHDANRPPLYYEGQYSSDEVEYPNHGFMRRMEDFKNMENVEAICNAPERKIDSVALVNMSIANHELAIPCVPDCSVTRMHIALHLLGCLDSLVFAHEFKLAHVENKKESAASPVAPMKEDFLTVNRFENHGGGWGYSGHSIEAIRFMCDTDILLGGYALFGGRGDYSARIKLFDIGPDGGDQETDGEMLAETEDVVFECPPRDKYPVLFDVPVTVAANRWYVAWACINGPSSDCGASGLAVVLSEDVSFHFKTSKRSNNGTDVNAGQIPCLLYNLMTPDHNMPPRCFDIIEPIVVLTKNISRRVTVSCFRSLMALLQWSWNSLKAIILDANGQLPITYEKLTTMKHQRRLMYIIVASLRLIKAYVNEIYPRCNRNRSAQDHAIYSCVLSDVRDIIQGMMADPTPNCSMLPRKPGKLKAHRACYVQLPLEMITSILHECHVTVTSCFHAFFSTPNLKWNHLCSLLVNVKDGVVPASQTRELIATCGALCGSRALRDVLQHVVPATQSAARAHAHQQPRREARKPDAAARAATVPRAARPPPVPPRANREPKPQPPEPDAMSSNTDWHLLDVVPRLLDIILLPIRRRMDTRQCGHTHDHGELRLHEQLATYCCKVTSRVVAELTHGITNIRDGSEIRHLVTPCRFMRVNQSRAWNTGSGSPDAVCFTVDRPDVVLAGACVYAGAGGYDYELELLHDVRLRGTTEDGTAAHCWVSLELACGTYSAADANNDVVQLKFDRPVPLREDYRYAVRLSNHGGRTVNGDCGLPSVKGPDGTTFRFASCSLSFNGTSLARGQIPSLIYYGPSRQLISLSENTDMMMNSLRSITIRVASEIMQRSADLLAILRSEHTLDELKRNSPILQTSPAFNTLIPFTLASLDGLTDSKSVLQILDMIHNLIPHVAAINLVLPPMEPSTSTTGHYYSWVESEHPYKQAAVTNLRVLFPASVAWINLEMDPRSITAQPEDTLTIYATASAPQPKLLPSAEVKAAREPFKKRFVPLTNEPTDVEEVDSEDDTPCQQYNCTYVAVTPKLANVASEWPQKSILVPGNEVVFSLETASDYLNEYNKANGDSRYGFRCLCVGYEHSGTRECGGLIALEAELTHAAAAAAAKLLAPDIEIPHVPQTLLLEVQCGPQSTGGGVDAANEAAMVARGLELGAPPTVHQVLDGYPLSKCRSAEKQFLSDFVAGAAFTAGGRLAEWLSPASRVEPSKCEVRPPATAARPNSKLSLPVVLRDQYGEVVVSPALRVEVLIQKMEEPSEGQASTLEYARNADVPHVPYSATVRDTTRLQSINVMKAFQSFSFEEIRFATGTWPGSPDRRPDSGRSAAVRVPVRSLPDRSHVAMWTPRVSGVYSVRCFLDEIAVPQDLTITVADGPPLGLSDRAMIGLSSSLPTRLRRFEEEDSAGLRVRASPSLQAEELGYVPSGGTIAFVEEVSNKDGTWVRLNGESMILYAEGSAVGWCLQYNRHLDQTLLEPLEDYREAPYSLWPDADSEIDCWFSEEDEALEIGDDKRFPFSQFPIDSNESDEADGSLSPDNGPEPSKRNRHMRIAARNLSKRRQRRSNGNGNGGEEWWEVGQYRPNRGNEDLLYEEKRGGRMTQTGTQTSPDGSEPSTSQAVAGCSSDHGAEQRSRGPPPPPPARVPLPPRRRALSVAQAMSVRAAFASIMWHEGTVHDAIACAAFLKFHPRLPKQGARVATRPLEPRPQRHSVEVTASEQYLSMQPSTVESLTRSALEASGRRKPAAQPPITEEGAQSLERAEPSFVCVLPPALRAIVALWDALQDADQFAVATDKYKDDDDRNELDEIRMGARRKRDLKTNTKASYLVRCELCAGSVPPPLAAHMRHAHPGCRSASGRGYDRAGAYRRADPIPPPAAPACGQLAQSYHLWYIYCEKCRERSLAEVAEKPREDSAEPPPPPSDHHVIMDNALFLLDLAPMNNSEPGVGSPEAGRSPPTDSTWLPAPPFQCLAALGAAAAGAAGGGRDARYHSLGRGRPVASGSEAGFDGAGASGTAWRVHRSVSMGQGGALSAAAAGAHATAYESVAKFSVQDTLSGVGSSLLQQPSDALQRLVCADYSEGGSVSAVDPLRLDANALMLRPTLRFLLGNRDLPAYRQRLEAAVRINVVRQYAFEALNWLIRSATQPTCVHDVMWWFCDALDRYGRYMPASPDDKESASLTATQTLCPGERTARFARSALHSFLGSVSALSPNLPASSAVALQAVRCFELNYANQDRAFLHRSQVFSVISRILSRSDDMCEDNMLGALYESCHSFVNKESYVWSNPDVTGWCDLAVSSRQGMAGALTDGSTETFWESGDEDRNKAKWLQISYPGGTAADKPNIVTLHVDNTRDTQNKILMVSFLYSAGSGELHHLADVEVDPKAASWLCYCLPSRWPFVYPQVPDTNQGPIRVRCELRGPEPGVRVRQLAVLGAPRPRALVAPGGAPALLHAITESDTLRVFRLLTSQVFGKLLEWDMSREPAPPAEPAESDTDLREHVVGILFAGHKLTQLQRQVMSHIVSAIGSEAARARDDWETALLCADAAERDGGAARDPVCEQDNYCFEMLSLLLALSGSVAGRSHLAQRTELIEDLLALLHTGSDRVQRQVITLLRRMIIEIPPQKMLAAVNGAASADGARVTLLDHLSAYLAKAMRLQVKIKGVGSAHGSVALGGSGVAGGWFLRGATEKKHAHMVATLIGDMLEDKLTQAWGMESRNALGQYLSRLATLERSERTAARCVSGSAVWLALAALAVCQHEHLDTINTSSDGGRRGSGEARPLCANHDDGVTHALIECRVCGALCAECDRFLHLRRETRSHKRQICKEEESAIRIDIHEGCGRVKLFWLLLLIDRRTLKALAEFRAVDEAAGGNAQIGDGMAVLTGECRFCGAQGNSGLLAIGNVCADQQCQDYGRDACARVLTCGHSCGGVRGERTCLPCLFGCDAAAGITLRQDADDMCMICFTDPLQAAPALQLQCGHVFHLHCCKKVLANKWNGPRITFSFSQCPICKEDMNHWTLEDLLTPIRSLFDEVRRKALMRLEYEGLEPKAKAQDPATYAMERYAYYVCYKCGKAYFGGLARCEAENSHWEPSELVCGACSDVTGARSCPKHGADLLEYKCRYCCSVAVFFCFGTSHFCNACHDEFQRITSIPRHLLPHCPAGPKCEQLPGTAEECPLQVEHPPTGEEFALGCGVCRHVHSF